MQLSVLSNTQQRKKHVISVLKNNNEITYKCKLGMTVAGIGLNNNMICALTHIS